jgi:dTDP-4-dehydrorhamnose 3,5-epimerase
MLNVIKTEIPDLVIIEPKVFGDSRGYFFESYKKEFLDNQIGKIDFVQDNESKSSFGVLRGLHFQKPPYAQAKLVRVVSGKVLDVALDVRIDSPHFGKYVAVELSEENKYQFFIPRGFAHGFVVLSQTAIFQYKVDNVYAPDHEIGIMYNDPLLSINWKLNAENISLSNKDKQLPSFNQIQFYSSSEYNKNL